MLVWKAYSRMIDALAFAPDGRALAVSGCYLACRVIDAITGERRWTAAGGSAFALSLAFGPGGAVLCRDRGLAVRAADTGAARGRFAPHCRSFAPDPDRRTAVVAVADAGPRDIVRRYDLATGEARGEVELEAGAINRVAVSPDGAWVAAVGCRRFHLLAADTLAVVATDAHRALSSGAFALAFSPDSNTVVYSAGRALFVWDVPTAREVARLHLDTKHFMDAAFTPDGRRLLTVSKEGAARVWDTATWECERVFAWDAGPLRAVAVAPDGTRAAVAGDTGRVVVWDLDV